MPCACNKKIEYDGRTFFDPSANTKPFSFCPLCSFKHLAYALVLYQSEAENERLRAVANIYLAYRHREKEEIYGLVRNFLNGVLTLEMIESATREAHEYAIDSAEKKQGNEPHLEERETVLIREAFCLLSANELFNFETGYRDVNYPYVLGLLLKAAELEPSGILKFHLRTLWKRIEAGKKISSDSILMFARHCIQRNKFLQGVDEKTKV